MSLQPFEARWRALLDAHSPDQRPLFPSYFLAPGSDDEDAQLSTTCIAHRFQIGTGGSIYTSTLLPALLSAQREVILVTCFWADSRSLNALRTTLEQVARRRATTGTQERLRIRIGFSSLSILQKLFHTTRREGHTYPPARWASLGLPPPELLEQGRIDLTVKSLFLFPFSVMHPKFIIIDRSFAFMPSANISWEPWLEGCVTVSGPIVGRLLRFYREVWEYGLDATTTESLGAPLANWEQHRQGVDDYKSLGLPRITNTSIAECDAAVDLGDLLTPAILLPSPHHRNPRFRFLPWRKHSRPPVTPLNTAILQLLASAQKDVFLHSPNFTCAAVIDALVEALDRGVDVRIVTGGKRMMLIEQLVTAGTTTSRCLKGLVKRYQKLQLSMRRNSYVNAESVDGIVDVESGISALGALRIAYFCPPPAQSTGKVGDGPEEPTHSHLKLMIVDRLFTVLGSGNMDRASFFTSQELGVLFHGENISNSVHRTVDGALAGKVDDWFSSGR